MLKQAADTRNSKDKIPNFRVFDIDEEGLPHYSSPLQKNEGGPQPMVYVLVSIMSHLFTYPPSVKHMVEQTQNVYGSSNFPIIYACGDTIYNITKKWFLSDIESKVILTQEIVRETDRWVNPYNNAISELGYDKNKHKNLSWSIFEEIPEYLQFKKFTDAILSPELSMSLLQGSFLNVKDSSIFHNLIKSIQDAKISEDIEKIADDYVKKNEKKLRSVANTGKRKDKEYQAQSAKRGKESAVNLEPGFEARKDGLKLDTRKFLANEYAVFLLLSYLTDPSQINENLKLQLEPSTLEITTSLQPILSYPISSGDSELTFATAKKIRKLYDQYSDFLSLLHIKKPTIFVNSLVPFEISHAHKMNALGATEFNTYSETSSEDSLERPTSSIASEQRSIHPLGQAATPELTPTSSPQTTDSNERKITNMRSKIPRLTPPLSPVTPPAEKYFSPIIEQDNCIDSGTVKKNNAYSTLAQHTLFGQTHNSSDIEQITSRIIRMIDEHLESGELTTTINKNGVTCTISVTCKADQNYVPNTESQRLIKLKDRITEAVYKAKTTGWEEEFTFIYKGYHFSFKAASISSYAYTLNGGSKTPSPIHK